MTDTVQIEGRRNTTDPLTAIRHLTRRAIVENERALTSREKLTERFLREIGREIAEAKRFLALLGHPWKHGEKSVEYEFMRIALDKAMTARKKDRRAELLRSWGDLQKLRERRLELWREEIALGPDEDSSLREAREKRNAKEKV
jgi:hypothetical protein